MSQPRQLAAPTYLVAFTLSIIPVFDEMMKLMPLRVGDPRWRFGAFGLASNALALSLAGLLIAFVATTVFEHALFRRILGILTGVAAVVIAGGGILFALDAVQVRNDVIPSAVMAFKVAIATASLKTLLGVVTLASLTIASFRIPRVASTKPSRSGMILSTGRVAQAAPISSREAAAAPVEPTA